jgi:hypothetical protein
VRKRGRQVLRPSETPRRRLEGNLAAPEAADRDRAGAVKPLPLPYPPEYVAP